MSSRQGWEGTVKVPAAPTERPNLQADYVSAHIRVYWPYTATDEQVAAAIFQAASEAAEATRLVRTGHAA